jgi:pilus assembly protein Flp/PilA
MRKFLNWLMNEESGQGMVEYALIIGLIAIVLIVALGWVTGGIQAVFQKIQTTLNAV